MYTVFEILAYKNISMDVYAPAARFDESNCPVKKDMASWGNAEM